MAPPHHRNRHPKYRKKNKIHNWRSYERSLINRAFRRLIHITADKGDDQSRVYEAANDILKEGGQINIHPRANVVVSASEKAALRQRNQYVKSIDKDSIIAYRRTSGYYRQSAVENMFFRYKKLIGDELRARDENSRRGRVCHILSYSESI